MQYRRITGRIDSLSNTTSSREISNFIKGAAIILVMASHFFELYDPELYQEHLSNYANAFISVFFILSGYGMFHSFERRFGSGENLTRVILIFFRDRFIRVYPVYLLAMVFVRLAFPETFSLHAVGPGKLVAILAGIPFVNSPLWFITAIFQCYLFAPLIYLVYRKAGARNFIILNLAAIGVVALVSEFYLEYLPYLERLAHYAVPDRYALLYRDIFLGNVLLFSAGMMMPLLIERYSSRLNRAHILYAVAALMAAVLFVDRYDRINYHYLVEEMELFNFATIYLFCLVAMVTRPRLPLMMRRALVFAGGMTLPLYVFHNSFFRLLARLSLLQPRHITSIVVTAMLLPALVYFCFRVNSLAERLPVFLERAGGRLRRVLAGGPPAAESFASPEDRA